MAEMTIRRCDRCGIEIPKGRPFRRITVHGHHETTLELCLQEPGGERDRYGRRPPGTKPCGRAFIEWMDPTGNTTA